MTQLDEEDERNDCLTSTKNFDEITYKIATQRTTQTYQNGMVGLGLGLGVGVGVGVGVGLVTDNYVNALETDQKSLSPDYKNRSTTNSSPELEVDSPIAIATSPALEVVVTTCASTSPRQSPHPFQKASPSKNSESFSVNALLRPDLPRHRNRDNSNGCISYHPATAAAAAAAAAFAETISVTRSLLYPRGLPFSDVFLKDEEKEITLNTSDSTAAASFLPRSGIHNFGVPHGIYDNGHNITASAKENVSCNSVSSADFLDANRNFLAGSFYLSLGAVQAAAAAAIGNPISPTITATATTSTINTTSSSSNAAAAAAAAAAVVAASAGIFCLSIILLA